MNKIESEEYWHIYNKHWKCNLELESAKLEIAELKATVARQKELLDEWVRTAMWGEFQMSMRGR